MNNRPWRPLRHFALVLLALTAVVSPDLLGQGRRARASVMIDGHEAVEGEVLVRYRNAAAAFERARAEDEVEADEVEPVGSRGTRRMRARRLGTREMMARLRANPDVEFVEPNYIIRIAATPNDPSFGNLWGLFNFGQNYFGAGIAGADIDATLAWDISTGTRANVVGVVDTGIDYNHPDLAANIWSAPSAFSVTDRRHDHHLRRRYARLQRHQQHLQSDGRPQPRHARRRHHRRRRQQRRGRRPASTGRPA